MANLAALCAVVFSLSAKNLRGGGAEINPLAGARVNTMINSGQKSGKIISIGCCFPSKFVNSGTLSMFPS